MFCDGKMHVKTCNMTYIFKEGFCFDKYFSQVLSLGYSSTKWYKSPRDPRSECK